MSQKNNDVELEHVIKLRLIIRTRRGGAGGGDAIWRKWGRIFKDHINISPPLLHHLYLVKTQNRSYFLNFLTFFAFFVKKQQVPWKMIIFVFKWGCVGGL